MILDNFTKVLCWQILFLAFYVTKLALVSISL